MTLLGAAPSVFSQSGYFRKQLLVVLELDIAFGDEQFEHSGEDLFQYVLHPLRTESINGAKIRGLSTRQPHERDVLPHRFGDLPGGANLLGVGIDDDLGQHLGMVGRAAATRVGAVEDVVTESLDRIVHHPCQVVRWDFSLQVTWQVKLIHGIVDV